MITCFDKRPGVRVGLMDWQSTKQSLKNILELILINLSIEDKKDEL